MSSSDSSSLLALARSIVPPLTHTQHKGQAGRIGILGGSPNYAGAPYFAAISAMKAGADLSYVFCSADAAPVIKSYSPELIVQKLDMNTGRARETITGMMSRLHSLVIGPGLGLDWVMGQDVVRPVIQEARERELPLVIDADGLSTVTSSPADISGYQKAILTPNVIEFSRLFDKVKPKMDGDKASDRIERTVQLSRSMGNVTIVHKGPTDVITNGENVLVCDIEGSPRRCGGQGDLLSGSMGLFSYWAHQAHMEQKDNTLLQKYGPTVTAAYAACVLTRTCSHRAFKQQGRSMLTTDMIQQIPAVFADIFEERNLNDQEVC